jgi:hypothetical protein
MATTLGATEEERALRLPGDELVPSPQWTYNHAVSIDAPRSAVWPWLVQLGAGRGGFYSYEGLENLVGCRVRNVFEIRADLQELQVGDKVVLHGRSGLVPRWCEWSRSGPWCLAAHPTRRDRRRPGAFTCSMARKGRRDRAAFVFDGRKVSLLEMVGRLSIPVSDLRHIKLPGVDQEFRGFDRSPYSRGVRGCATVVHPGQHPSLFWLRSQPRQGAPRP